MAPIAISYGQKGMQNCSGSSTSTSHTNYPSKEQDLLEELKQPWKQQENTPDLQHAPFAGSPNAEWHAPFTISEIETVVGNLTRNTTPGKD